MRRLSQPSVKTFNLLSIGQRGVGKTVFLAGSYAQLQANSLQTNSLQTNSSQSIVKNSFTVGNQSSDSSPSSFWFECQDEDMQANLTKILNYVEQTGLYPPATIKVTDFNFRLQQRTTQQIETVCQFRWWDIPGEYSNLRHDEFQTFVLASHACCVFVNARSLIHDPDYALSLQDSFNQVVAISSLVQQYGLKYASALILTQCDLLEPEEIAQLETKLQPLIRRLDSIKANYRLFYSAIPIKAIDGHFAIEANGAADSLLWLLMELNKHYRSQPERNLASTLSEKRVKQRFPPRLQRLIVVLSLTGIGLVGVGILLSFGLSFVNQPPAPLPNQEQEQRSP
ncbi:MAG: hypothetical protein C4288_09890 [Leptolyngbya sp. ERB_1_1]